MSHQEGIKEATPGFPGMATSHAPSLSLHFYSCEMEAVGPAWQVLGPWKL